MPYVYVDTSDVADEVFREASDQRVIGEVNRRIKNGDIARADIKFPQDRFKEDNAEWSLVDLAHDIRTAFYARNASRLEQLLVVLEQHEAAVA